MHPSAPLLAESIASNSSKEPDCRLNVFHLVWPMAELRAKRAESFVAVANIETYVLSVTPLQTACPLPTMSSTIIAIRLKQLNTTAAISTSHVPAHTANLSSDLSSILLNFGECIVKRGRCHVSSSVSNEKARASYRRSKGRTLPHDVRAVFCQR